MRDHVREQLGNYRVLRLLGRGGSASVYLGEHVYLKNQAALKILHTQLTDQDVTQFVTEAQMLARLSHPHIVRVLDFTVQDGTPFLVMEYAPHGTLRQRHSLGTRLPLEAIVTYVQQVAAALQYAHDQRLLHRDIKPENMLLDSHSEVLLSDFGLAMFTPHTLSLETLAMERSIAGTAPYLAPEQVQGKPQRASDQYALGVVVYEWLCGKRPFSGSPIEIALQHVSAAALPLHEQLPDLSTEVEQVVMRALAKAPEQRFPSVLDFATALQYAAHPTGAVYITTSAVPATSTSHGSQGEQEHPAVPADSLPAEAFWKVPASLTSLVGREQDVTTVCKLLAHPEIRLLTLLGVGGIGKTRLALQLASQLRDRFAAGVCFVGLAPLSDPSLVLPSIAHELGLQEAGAQPLIETVKAWLRDKHFLLLLDNFEQVVSAAPLLEDLLTACPRLVILVTSREVLRLSAEHLFSVPPLTLPDLARLPEQEDLGQYAAVSLFVQRAQALKPDFTLTPSNAHAIAEICVRLDGLPLAIELAAARIRVLLPQALLTRLSQRFQVLTSGSRTLPQRQQTLRNTIQWSYDLLTPEEQRLFGCLSVFVGGCTLEAVEAVCAALGNETANLLDGVASLIDKSLLYQTGQEGKEPRLAMLETIREFGLACLEQQKDPQAARQAHARYYLALAQEAEVELAGPQQAVWLERLEQEHDNLRAALEWLVERVGSGQVEPALGLCKALLKFWQIRGYFREGRMFLDRVLAASEGMMIPERGLLLSSAGHLAYLLDEYDLAEKLLEESLLLFQNIGHKQWIARVLLRLGLVSWAKNQNAAASSFLEEALVLYEELGEMRGKADVLVESGRVASFQGDYARAIALIEQALALSRNIGDSYRLGYVLYYLARVLFFAQGDRVQIRALAEESQRLCQTLSDRHNLGYVLSLLAQLGMQSGAIEQAGELSAQGVAILKEIGDRWGTAEALILWAHVMVKQGDLVRARTLYEESLKLLREIDYKALLALCLEGLGQVLAMQGELRWAAGLWGRAEALRETIGAPMPPVYHADYEQSVATIRTALGKEAFDIALAEGGMMELEQVLSAPVPQPLPSAMEAGEPSVPLARHPSPAPAGLTTRQVEVLRLLAQGLTDAQIAEQLVIARRTVNWYLTSIYSKLGVSSRAAATRYALEHHLL